MPTDVDLSRFDNTRDSDFDSGGRSWFGRLVFVRIPLLRSRSCLPLPSE